MLFLKSARTAVFRLFQIWEVIVFFTAFGCGYLSLVRAGLVEMTPNIGPMFFLAALGLALLWHLLLVVLGLYNSRRLVSRGNEIIGAVGAVISAAAMLALLGALTGQPTNLPPFLTWFMIAGAILMVAGRCFARLSLHAARVSGRNLRFISVVGAGPTGQRLVKELLSDRTTGYRLNGFFDCSEVLAKLPTESGPGRDIGELSEHLMREPVDEVLIALPFSTQHDIVLSVIDRCRRAGVPARLVWYTQEGVGLVPCRVETISTHGTSLLFSNAPSWGWHGHAKTAMDVIVSILSLPVLVPLIVIVGLLIKLDSPGPVFFLQTRAGRNKQPFRLYKFRTMRVDAEAQQQVLEARNEAGGPVFKIKADPRVTRMGRFLRRYSIDEMPQLINVLRGEMSIVGPRPLPLRDVERFEQDWYSRRFSVKPGLTCSWVLAGRSELEFDTWVRLDLSYIDNWSLHRDIMICLRTIPAILRGSGAY